VIAPTDYFIAGFDALYRAADGPAFSAPVTALHSNKIAINSPCINFNNLDIPPHPFLF